MQCHVIKKLDTTGATNTFYEIEKRKKQKNKRKNKNERDKSKDKKKKTEIRREARETAEQVYTYLVLYYSSSRYQYVRKDKDCLQIIQTILWYTLLLIHRLFLYFETAVRHAILLCIIQPVAPVVQVVNLEIYLCLSPGFEPQVGRTFDFICENKK